MGREFIDIFDDWSAENYEASTSGKDPEYRDVFENYDSILQEVADRVTGKVVEFGTGTGNLTAKLLKNSDVTGIEPNAVMRSLTAERFPQIELIDGDLLDFPKPVQVDAFVSSYVFHHLNDEEKGRALLIYADHLFSGGKVVFADTAFITEEAKQLQIEKERRRGYNQVADDLEREYYTTVPILTGLFEAAGFSVEMTKMNEYVWLMDATKK
jgi:putative AdoMet-dependent methyltransferase